MCNINLGGIKMISARKAKMSSIEDYKKSDIMSPDEEADEFLQFFDRMLFETSKSGWTSLIFFELLIGSSESRDIVFARLKSFGYNITYLERTSQHIPKAVIISWDNAVIEKEPC